MSWKLEAAAYCVLGAVLVTCAMALRSHYLAAGQELGEQRVQAAWDLQRARDTATAAQDKAAREASERQKEQQAQIEAERIAHETAQRENALRARLAAATAVERSLHTTLAGQRARLAAISGRAGASPELAAVAGQAATAGELLGQCATRYLGVAADADGLRTQVAGLQQFANAACRSGQSTSSTQ